MNEIISLLNIEKKLTSSTGETIEGGDNTGPLVTVALPDDDTLEAMFQALRSKLRAVCTLTDNDPVVVVPKLGEIRPE
jgi:hypothetical protein